MKNKLQAVSIMCARGNEQKNIFRDERNREHFVELLEELEARSGLEVHALKHKISFFWGGSSMVRAVGS